MTTDQIEQHIEKCQDLIDRIREYEGLRDQLKQPYWSKEEARKNTQEYNEFIVNLEAELQHLWNNR